MRANPPPRTLGPRDLGVVALLALTSVLYLTSLPHNLGAVDESNFIYEAKRIADGETMYRDVFDLITPLSIYATACALRVFGSDMAVARATIAVVHAMIVVCIYACGRLLGVGMMLAAVTGLAHLAIAHPTWPYVSQHWFATAGNIVVLLSLLRGRWEDAPAHAVVPGILAGILIGIQQQKGVPIAAASGAIFIAAWLIERRMAGARPWRIVLDRLRYFALGIAAVLIPLFVFLVATAGVEPLVQALITFPLVNYRQTYRSAWGGMQLFSGYYATFTFPTLLKLAPASAVPLLIRFVVVVAGRRHDDPRRATQALTLLVFALATGASVAYYPDIIHLAFIAPVFLVIAAEAGEWTLRSILPMPMAGMARTVVALGILAATGWQLGANRERSWATFSIPYDSAFGRIDLNDAGLVPVIDKARALVAASPSKEMFCYPSLSGPYLWTGAKNPTRYQFFSPNYNDRDQAREIMAILEARQTPLMMTSPLAIRKGDPIAQYLNDHYEVVRFGYLPKIWLYTRIVPEPPL